MNTKTQILIIDDHPSFVEGVSLLLQSIIPDSMLLVAHNGDDALASLKQYPDIDWIFLDLNLPDMSGSELIDYFKINKVIANIIVMTSEDSPVVIDKVLKSHVSGFLTKDFDRHILSKSIKTIESGGVYLTQEQALRLENYRDSLLREKQVIEESISNRQKETLLLISKGYSNHEIAESMGISESTVKTHVSSLIALFEADNRTHCVAEARRLYIL